MRAQPWLDFSGAPPMLIPQSVAKFWRGTTDPATGEYSEYNQNDPVTDYDRAVAVAWPGRSILEFHGSQVLVLYSEYDRHTWDAKREILACGGWLPTDKELRSAKWTDPIRWRVEEGEFYFMYSALDAAEDFPEDEYMPVKMRPGIYTVEYSEIESKYVGCFHRFVRTSGL